MSYVSHGWYKPRPSFAAGGKAQHCKNPRESSWQAAEEGFRYLKDTQFLRVMHCSSASDRQPRGCKGTDWAVCIDTGKSASGYVFEMNGPAVS